MDFSIQSLLPQAQGSASRVNVVDQDAGAMAEEFAKLLVAQIQNQDPEEPVDMTQIISQNAQFTSSLATVRLANQMVHYEQIATSFRSMGKVAEYVDPGTGLLDTGIIDGADYSTTPPSLIINGKAISMESITRMDGDHLLNGGGVGGSVETPKLQQLQMLGKTVEYFDPLSGNPAVGVVDEVDLVSAEGLVTINGTSVPLSDVIRVIN
ncbi:MAG: hypothetical protein IGS03_07175 [Candidatus Sericytochromatia bacterium]|nr:hypothetical protein [Candidatus Sericytochromatia bacterium]